jgi:hypothetical protein
LIARPSGRWQANVQNPSDFVTALWVDITDSASVHACAVNSVLAQAWTLAPSVFYFFLFLLAHVS